MSIENIFVSGIAKTCNHSKYEMVLKGYDEVTGIARTALAALTAEYSQGLWGLGLGFKIYDSEITR